MKFLTIHLFATETSIALSRTCLTSLLCVTLIFNTHFTSAIADTDLNPFIAEYKAENNYITGGKATLSLKQNNTGSYDFVLQTKPTGILKWSGKGNIREHAILHSLNAPFESSSYRYTDKDDEDRNYYIEFNRVNQSFQVTRRTQILTHPLLAGSLDRLSVTLSILSHLKNNPEFTSLDKNIINDTKTQKIVFTNHGTEKVSTGIGKINAARIHKGRDGSNRKTIIWIAQLEDTDTIIPVKIEQFKREKLTLRLILTRFSTVE